MNFVFFSSQKKGNPPSADFPFSSLCRNDTLRRQSKENLEIVLVVLLILLVLTVVLLVLAVVLVVLLVLIVVLLIVILHFKLRFFAERIGGS